MEALQRLEEEGHEIYYITARPEEHGERTMEWMIDNGFPVHKDRFYYGMKDEDKVHIIKELELDYYFDDKPAVLETLTNRLSKRVCEEPILQSNIWIFRELPIGLHYLMYCNCFQYQEGTYSV